MELNELSDKLYDLIEDNRHKQAFELLKNEIASESRRRMHLALLRRRYNDHNDKKLAGTISQKKIKIEISEISVALMDYIKMLDPVDIGSEVKHIPKEITNPILIFTQRSKVNNIRDFFFQLNFVQIEVKDYTYGIDNLKDFDLVIFDNQDLQDCPSKKSLNSIDSKNQDKIVRRIEKMDFILQNSTKFILHFGNRFFWVNDHRNRVQAANSKFSLHARTKEVIEFINTYRV